MYCLHSQEPYDGGSSADYKIADQLKPTLYPILGLGNEGGSYATSSRSPKNPGNSDAVLLVDRRLTLETLLRIHI